MVTPKLAAAHSKNLDIDDRASQQRLEKDYYFVGDEKCEFDDSDNKGTESSAIVFMLMGRVAW